MEILLKLSEQTNQLSDKCKKIEEEQFEIIHQILYKYKNLFKEKEDKKEFPAQFHLINIQIKSSVQLILCTQIAVINMLIS